MERQDEFVSRCEAWMAAALGTAAWTCFAAEDGDVVVGQLWIQLIEKIPNPVVERERHAYVTNVYVKRAWRGAGIAGRLLDHARAWCEQRHVDTMFLWPSELSRPLYRRHGFFESDAVMLARLEDAQD
jgi:GNAT superfamily N-acetyltransferase